MEKVVFLGPYGATFSHDAYNVLAETFGTPKATPENYIPAAKNGEILKLIAANGGFGAVAMETAAEARVTESVESFVELLDQSKTDKCPFHVIGAIRLKIHFALMVRPGIELSSVKSVVTHAKSFGACRQNINKLGVAVSEVSSNGLAAQLVATDPQYAGFAALGPKSAAEQFGLAILNPEFEDAEAVTTFFLIGPKSFPIKIGKENRSLLIFKTAHQPGAFVLAITPLSEAGINLIGIHSFASREGNRRYNFAVEAECGEGQLSEFHRARKKFEERVLRRIVFGPFGVFSG